MRTLTEIE